MLSGKFTEVITVLNFETNGLIGEVI